MSIKSRRRVLAVGAFLAGATIPLAAAGTAWAGTDLSVNGVQVYDSFTGGEQPAQSSPGGNVAEYTGPQADGASVRASDVTGDTGDTAIASNSNTPGQAPSNANIIDASNSTANASNGGQATVEGNTATGSVTNNDHATASGANTTALVENSGSGTVSNNYATASNTNGTTTSTEAEVYGFGSGPTSNNNASATNGGIAVVENATTNQAVTYNNASATGVGNDPLTGGSSAAIVINQNGVTSSSQPVTANSATATNGGFAVVANDGGATQPVEFNATNANNGAAFVTNGVGSSSTAVNTGPATTFTDSGSGYVVSPGAYVNDAAASTAYASGPGATAGVQGEPSSYVFNDHAIQTVPGSTVITYPTSNSTVMNDPPPAVHSAVVPAAPMMPMHMPLLP